MKQKTLTLVSVLTYIIESRLKVYNNTLWLSVQF